MDSTIQFGQYLVKNTQLFFRSKLSYGLVNLKPIRPGHVLVIPKRNALRYKDLTPEEISDVFISTQKISVVLEKVFSTDSLTFAVQDGPAAGQTVFHVHVHIIPRVTNDFKKMMIFIKKWKMIIELQEQKK